MYIVTKNRNRQRLGTRLLRLLLCAALLTAAALTWTGAAAFAYSLELEPGETWTFYVGSNYVREIEGNFYRIYYNDTVVQLGGSTTGAYLTVTGASWDEIKVRANSAGTDSFRVIYYSPNPPSTGYLSNTVYYDITVKQTSFTVSYNANGGTGAPASQTKQLGESIRLRSGVPEKEGYTFEGWASSRNAAEPEYQPEEVYSLDRDLQLYAVWKLDHYVVRYNANGGSGAPAAQDRKPGAVISLRGTEPQRTGYTFAGWKSSASGHVYGAGDSFSEDGFITLSAVWNMIPIDSITLNKTKQTVYIGRPFTLTASIKPASALQTVTWSSDKPAVADVSGGTVSAYQEGTAVITAASADGKTASCTVTVKRVRPESIALDKTRLELSQHGRERLTVSFTPADTTNKALIWSSGNPAVAVVEDGYIRCVAPGTTTITAKAADGGITAACTLAVSYDANAPVPLDDICFPDAAFLRAAVAFDKDGDGLLTTAERGSVTEIACAGKGIGSLQGLAFFPNLKTLDCASNSLTGLDLSASGRLETLKCGNCGLTALDLGANTGLRALDCASNRLTKLELGGLHALESLNCASNDLTALDLGANTGLRALDCASNRLTKLELGGLYALEDLNCASNALTALNFGSNTGLRALDCSDTLLTGLDLGAMKSMTELNCANDLRLTAVTLPSGMTQIGREAFRGCGSLREIALPAGISAIGSNAFAGCAALTELVIPGSVTDIGTGVFADCGSLTLIVDIDSYAADHCVREGYPYRFRVMPSGQCGDDLTWQLENYETLRIRGTGAMYDYAESGDITDAPWGTYSGVEKLIIEENVTDIGACAFYGLSNLRAVSLPEGLKTIGKSAFHLCEGLTEIAFPESLSTVGPFAFCLCTGIESVDLKWHVTNIGEYAFYKCSALNTLTLRDGELFWPTLTIGEAAFGYTALRDVVIPWRVNRLPAFIFTQCSRLDTVTVPTNVRFFSNLAFYDNRYVTLIVEQGSEAMTFAQENDIDYRVAVIPYPHANETGGRCGDNLSWELLPGGELHITGTGDMYDYSNEYVYRNGVYNKITSAPWYNRVSRVVIEDGVTSIGELAFKGCEDLTQAVIPDSVRSIGIEAFSRCPKLKEAVLPSGLTYIEEDLFYGDTGLERVNIPSGVTAIEGYAFNNCALTELRLPESVESIGRSAFYGCGITDIYYEGSPEQWNAIRIDYSDNRNDPLKNAVIHYNVIVSEPDFVLPAALTEIGSEAFAGGAFSYVLIPETVTRIDSRAFAACPKLRYAAFMGADTVIDPGAFDGVSGLKIIAPSGSKAEAYADTYGFPFVPVS